jgi:hypothetical protein
LLNNIKNGGDNMTILEIFEKVNLVIPIEQRVFFNFFEDTVNELFSLYGDFVIDTDKEEKTATQGNSSRSVDADGNVYINGILVENLDNGDDVKASSEEYTPPKSLTETNVVLPLYHNSIVDNILFLANKGESYKSEFIRKSRDAYLKYWNDSAKGRRIRRMRW